MVKQIIYTYNKAYKLNAGKIITNTDNKKEMKQWQHNNQPPHKKIFSSRTTIFFCQHTANIKKGSQLFSGRVMLLSAVVSADE
jgi:hypothetical protein